MQNIARISLFGEHYFFGYYDIQPWNQSQTRHLAHKCSFINRIPDAKDEVLLGFFEFEEQQQMGLRKIGTSGLEPFITATFHEMGCTHAWNFQQGAMLQWNPDKPDREVIFNIRDNHEFRGKIVDIETGTSRMLERPVATVNPTGGTALSINFQRLFDFRPGYGYAGIEDPFKNNKHPENDGVFLVDLFSGESTLKVSLAELWDKTKQYAEPGDHKIAA